MGCDTVCQKSDSMTTAQGRRGRIRSICCAAANSPATFLSIFDFKLCRTAKRSGSKLQQHQSSLFSDTFRALLQQGKAKARPLRHPLSSARLCWPLPSFPCSNLLYLSLFLSSFSCSSFCSPTFLCFSFSLFTTKRRRLRRRLRRATSLFSRREASYQKSITRVN